MTATMEPPALIVDGKPLHCRACGAGPLVPRCDEVPPQRWHSGRGLDHFCYRRAHRTGTLVDYPRITCSNEDAIEDWQVLAAQGLSRRQAAERIGISHAALDKAISRWRRRQSASP